jgi:hypothetical protein
MPLFQSLNTGNTGGWFGNLSANLRAIAANFGLLEPRVTDSGAADYVPVLADRTITRSRATAQTLTLPSNATAAHQIGTRIAVVATGAGVLTFQAGAGATMGKAAGAPATALVGGTVWAIKTAINAWSISGDLG